jgi:hypothetical protein
VFAKNENYSLLQQLLSWATNFRISMNSGLEPQQPIKKNQKLGGFV